MSTDPSPSSHYAQAALAHIRRLAVIARGSATAGEKQAADYVVTQLKGMGVADVRVDSFTGLRSLWLFLAQALGLALVGHAAFWLLRKPAGNLPALLVSVLAFGLSGYLVWRMFTFNDFPLKRSLPHGPSQNVMAVIPASGEAQRKVVLVSHLDSHRAVFWFASDTLVVIFALVSFITLYGIYLAIPLYLLAVLTGLQAFAWLGLGLAFFHFLGWFTGVTADLGGYSPGANDNASGMGTVLSLAQRLKEQPLQNTELWLAFTGCEESGCDGMVSLIRAHGETLKPALFIDLEMVGIGDRLCYTAEEGNLRRHHIPADVEALVKAAGEPYGLDVVKGPRVGAFSEGGTLWEYGFKAVCISAHYKDTPILPEWHRLTDTPSRIQEPSLERIQDFTWALLQRFDQRGF